MNATVHQYWSVLQQAAHVLYNSYRHDRCNIQLGCSSCLAISFQSVFTACITLTECCSYVKAIQKGGGNPRESPKTNPSTTTFSIRDTHIILFFYLSIERFFPFGGARLVSIFHFVPNSSTWSMQSYSLQDTIQKQQRRASVVDLLLPLLPAPIQEVAAVFSCSTWIKITSFGNFTLKFFFREISPLFPKEFPNNVCVPNVKG